MTTALPSILVRPIRAKVAVDPITAPLARRLGNATAITPNRATPLAGLLALGASASFILGGLRTGRVLAFYVIATIVNICRTWQIAGALGSETARVG